MEFNDADSIYGLHLALSRSINAYELISLNPDREKEIVREMEEQFRRNPEEAWEKNEFLLNKILECHLAQQTSLSETERNIVSRLLQYGADFSRTDRLKTALFLEDEPLFKLLCQYFITAPEEAGCEYMFDCYSDALEFAENGRLSPKLTEWLYTEYAATPKRCTCSLYHAVKNRYSRAARYFLENGADDIVIDEELLCWMMGYACFDRSRQCRQRTYAIYAALIELRPERMTELLRKHPEVLFCEGGEVGWSSLIGTIAEMGKRFVRKTLTFCRNETDMKEDIATAIMQKIVYDETEIWPDTYGDNAQPILEYVLENGAKISDEMWESFEAVTWGFIALPDEMTQALKRHRERSRLHSDTEGCKQTGETI